MNVNEFPKKIVIIGLGLIGGSIALGLKKHFGAKITILGSCGNPKRTKIAKESGIIDAILDSLHSIPQNIKFIIIATPIRTSLEIIKKLSKMKLGECLIMDVGSTKKVIDDVAQKLLPPSCSFIGTHPMAGSELSGFENASVNLFRNKPWIICTAKKANKNNLLIVKELISILGSRHFLMNSEKHDELTIWASHIFLAASSILVNTIAKQKDWQEIAKIASTGFRDTTRLASDNPRMKTDIVVTNKNHLLYTLDSFKNELQNFSRLIQDSDDDAILKYFQNAKRIRDNWLANYFS